MVRTPALLLAVMAVMAWAGLPLPEPPPLTALLLGGKGFKFGKGRGTRYRLFSAFFFYPHHAFAFPLCSEALALCTLETIEWWLNTHRNLSLCLICSVISSRLLAISVP